MDRKDFLAWHEEFVQRCAKLSNAAYNYSTPIDYKPQNMDEWLDLLDKNHEGIREKLGGVSKTFKIDVKSDEPPSAPYNSVYDIMIQVRRILPNYYDTYYLDHSMFQKPKLTGHRNISGTKHIMGYADRQKIEGEPRKELEKLTEQLGQLWAQTCKAPKAKGYITLTTEPKAFCLIGRLDVCGASCFAQGKFNSDKKYALGIHNNSFIVYAHEDEKLDMTDEKKNNIVARALGVMTGKDMEIMNTVNHHPSYYGRAKALNANQVQMQEVAQQFFGAKDIGVQSNKLILTHGIHYGDYCGFSFYDTERLKSLDNKQYVKVDPRYSKEAHPKGDMYGKWDGMPTPDEY